MLSVQVLDYFLLEPVFEVHIGVDPQEDFIMLSLCDVILVSLTVKE